MSERKFSREDFYEILNGLQNHSTFFYQFWQAGLPIFNPKTKTARICFDKGSKKFHFEFNPNWWDESTFDERLFMITHICSHVILQHFERNKGLEKDHADKAMDMCVNELILRGFEFTKEDAGPDWESQHWYNTVFPQGVERNMNFEYYYNILKRIAEQQQQQNGQQGQQGKPKPGQGKPQPGQGQGKPQPGQGQPQPGQGQGQPMPGQGQGQPQSGQKPKSEKSDEKSEQDNGDQDGENQDGEGQDEHPEMESDGQGDQEGEGDGDEHPDMDGEGEGQGDEESDQDGNRDGEGDGEGDEQDDDGEVNTLDDHDTDIPKEEVSKLIEQLNQTMSEDDKERMNNLMNGLLAGTGTTGTLFKLKAKHIPKRKWEEVIKNWAKNAAADFEAEQWIYENRRTMFLANEGMLPADYETDAFDKKRIDVWFYMDTSGSCQHLIKRFWKAAHSLPRDTFNVHLYGFTTRVYDITKGVQDGGTAFDILEKFIQAKIAASTGYQPFYYPKAVFVITDGYGNNMPCDKPKRWHWFLTENATKSYIPKDSKIYNLNDYE